jgi:HAD superfamily hydrolase (TIGR01493 family)
MSITLALDIYGTLINPLAVRTALAAHVGDDGPAFAGLWRTKQLEYSFRRGLMGAYRDIVRPCASTCPGMARVDRSRNFARGSP